MKQFVGYYRVSTVKQGESGLGLAAQTENVKRFIENQGSLIQDFTEIESGKNSERPFLMEAIAMCKEKDATLVIAKLDRLSRDAKFILTLQDSGVQFVCVDMPDANHFTVGLFALIAQQEIRKTSERTVEALGSIQKEIEEKGYYTSKAGNIITSLGGSYNFSEKDRERAYEKARERAANNPNNKRASAFIETLTSSGITNKTEISRRLNASGFVTARGKEFTPMQVSRLMK